MKKILYVLMIAILLLAGCSNGKSNKTFSTLSDFEGTVIGVQNGTISENVIGSVIKDVEYKSFITATDLVEALSSNKVDAIYSDLPGAIYLTAKYPEFTIFPESLAEDKYGFAVAKDSPLTENANNVLQKMKESGVIEELEEIWLSTDESKKTLPALTHKEDFDGSAGMIRYGFDSTLVPMSYLDSSENPVGFDLDLISRIAYELNMTVEFVPMNFDALFLALLTDKVDMVGGSMSITEERLEKMDFIGPYCESNAVLMIKEERME